MSSTVGRWRPPARVEDLVFAACLFASFVACAWIVYHVDSPNGDLIHLHTDHLHHVLATWTFWHEGFDVYREPFRQTAARAPYALVTRVPWPDFPIAYPPGMFAIFAVPTWFGAKHPTMEPETFAKWTVGWVVLLSHVGLVGVWRALGKARGGRVPLLVGIWLLTWRMCLCGFYDAIWVGCAAMSIAALADRKWGKSLVWFAVALSMNYRAASVAPIAAWALWRLFASDAPAWRKLLPAWLAVAVGVLVLWTFWLFTKGSPPHESHTYQSVVSHLSDEPALEWFVWGAGAVTAAIAVGVGDYLVAVTVVWATQLTMLHSGHSWHGTMLIASGLVVGAARRAVPVAFLRNVVAMWMFAVWSIAFDHPPFAILYEVLVRAKFK